MSKKNLSLLMDGFMGEANQAELAKEQPKEKAVEQVAEQAEQPAAQDDKQEIPKAAPAKASSKQETTETAAPEQLKSKLDAKRRENVGRPKKGETAKSVKKPQEIRATFIVDPDLVRKVKYISLVEGIRRRSDNMQKRSKLLQPAPFCLFAFLVFKSTEY